MGLDNLENSGGPLRELFEKKNAGMSDRKSGEKSWSDGGDTGPKRGSVCRKDEEMRLQRGQIFMDAEVLG